MSYALSLRKQLELLNAELNNRLPRIEAIAKGLLAYTQGKFPYYTPHNFDHSLSVEENLNWLIPDKIKEEFNSYELFFLIICAWLHDWGMIGSPDEDADEIRETHHIRTENFFEIMHEKVGLNYHEARIAGRICKGHRRIDLYDKEYDDMVFGASNRIRTRFLAALLRIADEADITHNRTPEIVYYSINPKEKAEEEFRKHLNITGVGQLDEPYKIYINAISRDPKGAQALRCVKDKIQKELDGIKNILSKYNLFLDVVELRMETYGFIDKPIAFEINRNKIMDILIGKHLYGNTDVAIRELVQNAIDACSVKKMKNTWYTPRIEIVKDNSGNFIVTDNGSGMGYIEAKRFLSNIGTSYYSSEDFRKSLGNSIYDPISHFGIGLLSAFLISDSMVIETKKDGEDPCRFTISGISDDWKYEKGCLKESGTIIRLKLNEDGKKISIQTSLQRYIITTTIPIFYKEYDEPFVEYRSAWEPKEIAVRYIKDKEFCVDKMEKILEINSNEFDCYLLESPWQYLAKQLILFNKGVYVNQYEVRGLNGRHIIMINTKKDSYDLHVSREDVVKNARWAEFLCAFFTCMLSQLFEKYEKVQCLCSMIEDRLITDLNHEKLQSEYPFLFSVLNIVEFPCVDNMCVKMIKINDFISNKDIAYYMCCSYRYLEELELYKRYNRESAALFDPYRMPRVGEYYSSNMPNLFEYICQLKGRVLEKQDLRTILSNVLTPIAARDYSKILPENILLGSFGDLKPIFFIHKKAIIKQKTRAYFGSHYWGNIILWNNLIDKNRRSTYLSLLEDAIDNRFGSLELIKGHIVYLDASDIFIREILKKYSEISDEDCEIVKRYFAYLSYFPIVMGNLASCLIFIEVIEKLEMDLSLKLNIDRPPEIFKRMVPNFKLYYSYYEKNGEEILQDNT